MQAAATAQITDVDILNFALNLEYLEAQFYSYAVSGKGLTDAQRGGGPQAQGGQKAHLTGVVKSVAAEIASDELKCPPPFSEARTHDIPI